MAGGAVRVCACARMTVEGALASWRVCVDVGGWVGGWKLSRSHEACPCARACVRNARERVRVRARISNRWACVRDRARGGESKRLPFPPSLLSRNEVQLKCA